MNRERTPKLVNLKKLLNMSKLRLEDKGVDRKIQRRWNGMSTRFLAFVPEWQMGQPWKN